MLPYLSRVSLWLAALAAAASLFTPGRQGALLATVAMVALIGALVLRRFQPKAQVAAGPVADVDATCMLDDAALLDVATLVARGIARSATLADAMHAVRGHLVHELGAYDVTLHGVPPQPEPLVVADRFPLGDALRANAVAGSAEAGFAMPVACGGEVVAMLDLRGTELCVDADALGRLLQLVKAQLDGLAERERCAAWGMTRAHGLRRGRGRARRRRAG